MGDENKGKGIRSRKELEKRMMIKGEREGKREEDRRGRGET